MIALAIQWNQGLDAIACRIGLRIGFPCGVCQNATDFRGVAAKDLIKRGWKVLYCNKQQCCILQHTFVGCVQQKGTEPAQHAISVPFLNLRVLEEQFGRSPVVIPRWRIIVSGWILVLIVVIWRW